MDTMLDSDSGDVGSIPARDTKQKPRFWGFCIKTEQLISLNGVAISTMPFFVLVLGCGVLFLLCSFFKVRNPL